MCGVWLFLRFMNLFPRHRLIVFSVSQGNASMDLDVDVTPTSPNNIDAGRINLPTESSSTEPGPGNVTVLRTAGQYATIYVWLERVWVCWNGCGRAGGQSRRWPCSS
jgi:hypothetical protein